MKSLRIAALSDIHGNLAALDAVLADVERRRVDIIVNLGDIVSGPLDPAGTANRLMPLGLPTIRGNHERQLLTQPPALMCQSDRHADQQLTAGARAWLASLPPTLRLADDVFLCHGTADSDLDYLLEHVDKDGARPATLPEIEARAKKCDASLILCGHSHVPRTVRLDAWQLVVNPGSVGLPAYACSDPYPHVMEASSPHARYAITEYGDDRTWTAELIAVEYDWEAVAQSAAASGRDDWAFALRSGRAGLLESRKASR
jgi:predicted phosphodiesterase